MDISIIVPHRNIPDLLKRCIDSIPTKDNIEVIIVDDNSDNKMVDFKNFPGIDRENTKVLFTKDGKGAGYARNVGIKEATGNWIMFADADDFFLPNAFDIIKNYFSSNYDVVYFNGIARMNEDLSIPSNRMDFHRSIIAGSDINLLRCQANMPMMKLIRHSIIHDNKIYFDETPVANDIYFSLMVGIKAKNIGIDKRDILCVTDRIDSLMTHNHTKKERIIRMLVILKCNRILCKIGMSKYTQDSLEWYIGRRKKIKEFLSIKYIFIFFKYTKFNSFKYIYWTLKSFIHKYHNKQND